MSSECSPCIPLPNGYQYPPIPTRASQVSFAHAVHLIQNWINFWVPFSHDNVIPRGFLIPIDSIKEIAALANDNPDKATYARVYFGLGCEHPVDARDLINIKLLMVPVDVDGNDSIVIEPELPGKTYIYDFTHPCPPFCPRPSNAKNPLHLPPYPNYCPIPPEN